MSEENTPHAHNISPTSNSNPLKGIYLTQMRSVYSDNLPLKN